MPATLTRGSVKLCLPRFGTPRDLTRRTLGPAVGVIARKLGTPLMPWQQHVVDVGLELLDDGSFAYSEVDVEVPRQSGKTRVTLSKTVWRMSAYAVEHGPQTSTYTAQKRKDARKRFERTFAPAIRAAHPFFVEVEHNRLRPRKPTEWRLSLNNGAECFQFGDSYWQIEGVDDKSGHGDTLDDGTIDEARFHLTDGIEAAMSPAQITRTDAQLWVVSSAGDEKSPYLYRKVLAGRAACESGEHGRTAFFEWSAPDDADPGDPATWWACMPALGHTITEERIAAEWEKAQRKGQEGIDTFKQEYLGIWVTVPILEETDAEWCFPKGHWIAATSTVSEFEGSLALALSVAPDRSWSAIGVAGRSSVGGIHGGCLEYREGTAWVVNEVKARCKEWSCPIVVARGSAAMALVPDLERAGVTVEVFSSEQQAQAFGQLYDAIVEGRFKHPPQPHVDVAVREAETRETAGGALLLSAKRSAIDISPIEAVTLAASKYLDPGGKPAEPEALWL